MALVLKDRVVETTDVAGTGSASLLGAQDGYQAFSVIGNGNTTYYTIYDPVAFDWEVGIGTYASSGNVLARTTVLSSSNSGSLVAFGSGTKDIFLDLPSEKVVALGALTYQGTWNATTNVPTLASGVGTQGYYYVVATAGSTNLDGITDWKIGDWAIYSGTAWQKIDNTDAVSSVNGQTGTVVLTYSDVGAQVAGTYVTSVSGTAPVASSGGTTPAISMAKATGSVDGYLSSTDWTTFNNKGTVTSVTGTAPVVSSGGATPAISMAAATSSVNGYLTSTDWTTFNDKQSAFGSQTANYVYAAPNGSAGTPSFRALVSADIPSLSYIPYTGATSAVDLNAKTLVNVDHLGVGTATVPTILARVVGDNGSVSRIALRGYSSDANSSAIRVAKFRGNAGAPQVPISGDSLGKFELAGYGSTSADSYPQASIEGVTTELWSAVARGTKALIKVTPNTTINQVTAVTIDQDLSVTTAGALTVTGHTTFEGVTSTGATGTGKLVYDTSPSLTTPALGTPSALVGTNITGTASGLTAGTVTTNANLTGAVTSVGNATTMNSGIDSLTDVIIATPTVDQILKYNGAEWVNGAASSISAGYGIEYFNATPQITASGTNSALAIFTLSATPVTTAEQTATITTINGTVAGTAWVSTALNRTTIDAGSWQFTVFASVSSVAGVNTTISRQMYAALPFVTGTVTTTGTGTSRTATASAGTPFAVTEIVASATNTLASYLQTPQGLYQITARTSDTVVTISTLTTYANESAVAGTVWKLLFASGTTSNLTTTITQYDNISVQPAFTISLLTHLGAITFATSTGVRTVTTTYNGTLRNTHIASPLAILHNQLGGLQGGVANELYHSTLAEYTGSGTGVFARVTSPVFVTPALGTPTSGNLSSCTADGTDQVGFKNIPQNSQSAAYTLVLADAGKHIYHPASDANVRTFTIPAASSVAYPIGTAITFVNLSASVVTIAITTDTMYLSSAGTTGSRSLAQYGTATALKVSGLSSAGIWVISGSGLT